MPALFLNCEVLLIVYVVCITAFRMVLAFKASELPATAFEIEEIPINTVAVRSRGSSGGFSVSGGFIAMLPFEIGGHLADHE